MKKPSLQLILLLLLFVGSTARAGSLYRLHDTIPATDSLYALWDQVTSFRAGNGVLVGITETGQRVEMNRSLYRGYRQKNYPGDSAAFRKTYTKIEFEPEYPGGIRQWYAYLRKNMHYPRDAENNGIEGPVVLNFIVDEKGEVSEIETVSGPTTGGLRDEALRLLKESGTWNPGIQNKGVVRAYKKATVNFRLRDLPSKIVMR